MLNSKTLFSPQNTTKKTQNNNKVYRHEIWPLFLTSCSESLLSRITVTKYTTANKFPIPADNCCLRERWEDAAGF